MSKCNCVKRPDGFWSISELKGAKVKIISVSPLGLVEGVDPSKTYTLSDIIYRVSLDGRVVSVVKLEELEDLEPILTLKDIRIESVKN